MLYFWCEDRHDPLATADLLVDVGGPQGQFGDVFCGEDTQKILGCASAKRIRGL